MKHLVAPSLLSADFSNLRPDIEMVNQSQADWFHLDIMDGTFVPNISFGLPVVKAIKKYAAMPLDVHLMIVQPERYIMEFKEAGANILSVHYEACTHLHRTLHTIRQQGMKAGIVLNPHTSVILLDDIISEADLVLIMSVNPGYGGQQFIENTYGKIGRLKELVLRKNPDCLIEVDGGVTLDNARMLLEAGADVLVAGNTIFAAADPIATILRLKNLS
ncbi:MAG: ribulose-phosphate 3-epimerase [Bacteroidales bacterium]|nr:ribulose-phosphate 3-epimerase [Bacteroidales bacterium]MDZ4204921.1 ribulose-phosphate 3-epimerase [Bacteroidales bacterium]